MKGDVPMPFRIKSIRNRLTIAFISLMLLVIFTISFVVVQQVISKTIENFETNIAQQVDLIDQSISIYSNHIVSNTRMLATMPIFQEADDRITSYIGLGSPGERTPMIPEQGTEYEQLVYGILNAFQTSNDSVLNASIGVESNGGFLKSPPSPRFYGYDAREREWYKKAIENPGQVVISEIYMTSSHEYVLLCVMTVHNERGERVGVITVDFDLYDLSETISMANIGETGYVILTDSSGMILAHPKDPNHVGRSINDLDLGQLTINDEVIPRQLSVKAEDGISKKVNIIESELNIFPLRYVVVLDESELYASGIDIIFAILPFIFILLILVLMLTHFLSNRLSLPLIQLSEFSDLLAKGDLSKRFQSNRIDEIGLLANRFNFMAESLESIKDTLEERVAERTLDLEKKNEELENALIIIKRTQEQLIQSEKLTGLSTLVAGISHEINTPLGVAITGNSFLEHLVENLIKSLKEERLTAIELQNKLKQIKESSEIISRNLFRSKELVESFKKVSVDHSTDEKRYFFFVEYIQEVINSLSPLLRDTCSTVKIHAEKDFNFLGHPSDFAQIFTNLVTNSIKHGFKNQKNNEIHIHIKKSDDSVSIIYEDNGIGVKEDYLHRLFEPFFTTERTNGGTGLGLHIIYNIVNLKYSGKISVKNREDSGLRFTLSLPLKKSQ